MSKTHRLFAIIWLFVVGTLLAYNVYLWLDKRITLNTDILALLPAEQQDPVIQQAFNHMVETAQQQVAVLIGATNWTQATQAADAYINIINTRPDILQLNQATSEQTQTDILTFFAKSRLGLLTSAQQTALQTQPSQYWSNIALSLLYNPFSGPKLGAWQDDPFGLFSAWLQARAQETPVRPRDGKLFVADQDHYYVVLLMNLRGPAFSMATQKAAVPLLAHAKQAALQTVPQAEIITAGVVLHAAAASTQASYEMHTIAIGSLLGIIFFMWLTFRSLKPMLLIALSLAVGFLGAFSIGWFVLGQIHLLTLVFGASLIGVAQDYGIYFLCSRLAANKTISSLQLLKHIWPGLCLTLVAAIVGYTGLALTPFPGLRQMALFSSIGLIFAWLTVVCWFPLLVNAQTLKITRFAEHFAASHIYWPVIQKNKITFIAGILFCVFAIIGWSKLTVSDDIRSLQKPSPVLLHDQIKLSQLLDAPSPVQFYLVRGTTPEIVLQREELLKAQLDPLISKGIISGYQAMSNWVPSIQTQKANHQLVQQKLLLENGPLKNIAQQISENNTWIQTIIQRSLAANTLLTPNDFLQIPLSTPWHYLWLGRVNNNYASIVALRGLNNYANLPLLKQMANKIEGVQWIDKVGAISAVLGHYRQYMSWVVLCAYSTIYLLLFLRYRFAAWRVLMPPAIASIATIALLGFFGISLQLFHVLALMLILGLGVDYGIFLQERAHQADHFAWLTVGLSAISALLSFGLLALSQTPPLHAFGLTMLCGMAIVWGLAPCFGKKYSPV